MRANLENSRFKTAIKEALLAEYEQSIPHLELHVFSHTFEAKMQKLVKQRNKLYYRLINTTAKKIACIIISIILTASLSIVSVEAFRQAFIDFIVDTFDRGSSIQSFDKNGPETMEEIYEITYDLNGYTCYIWSENANQRMIEYRCEDIIIDFYQQTKSAYNSLINTEGTTIDYEFINGAQAIYFIDPYNYHSYIWDNGNYIFTLHSNIDKETLKIIAASLRVLTPK